uniref:Uncharacterized protein n=1 Tax=Rhizophora mucronata TaxID=61149 RepID=A0A2P2PD79_RHIMU
MRLFKFMNSCHCMDRTSICDINFISKGKLLAKCLISIDAVIN